MAVGARLFHYAVKLALDLIQAAQDQGKAVGGSWRMKEALSLGRAGVNGDRASSWDRSQPLHSAVAGVASPFRLTPLSRTGRI